VTEVEDRDGTKGLFTGDRPSLEDVPLDTLRDSIQQLSASLGEIFRDVQSVGGFTLQEVKLQAEVSASGSVQLIGTAKAGGKGAITLTFRPPESTE
jgi:hypothetical protein